MTQNIRPQLAKLASDAPDGNEWLHEVKFDGYRLLCFINQNTIRWMTRNQKNWSQKLTFLTEEIKNLNISHAILDGELIALGQKGRSNFQLLQNTIHTKDKKVKYIFYAFDIIAFNRKKLTSLPLLDRKKILKKILGKKSGSIKYSNHTIGHGPVFFKKACQKGLEGIISKKIESPYLQKRTSNWLKVKCTKRQEFIICGYTPPKHSRECFGSLLLGVYDDEHKKLLYCGKVGTGFSSKTLNSLSKIFKKYQTHTTQFKNIPKSLKKVFWLKPKLVAEVEFTEWTHAGSLRHPSFKGLREDKNPKDISREQ